LYLFGHSLGGLITLSYLQNEANKNIHAAAVTSPFLGLSYPIPAWKTTLAKKIKRFAPKMALPTGFDGSILTHDEQIVQAYNSDPQIVSKATAGWFINVQKAQEKCILASGRIKLPVCIIQAGDDKLASPETTSSFADSVNSDKIDFTIYDGCYHEVLNEPDYKEQAFSKIKKWYEKYTH
jgi:lysophospholipase